MKPSLAVPLTLFFLIVVVFFFSLWVRHAIGSFIYDRVREGLIASPAPAVSKPVATSTNTFQPGNFRGPVGPPHIIGPKQPPPNY